MTDEKTGAASEAREFMALAHRLADASGDIIRPLFRTNIESHEKGDKDNRISPVTEADRGAERVMRELIESTFPDHGIIGEEYGRVRDDAECVWVLDPIDGTDPFLAGLPAWGTLIGMQRNGYALIGMMDQPFIGERFFGGPDGAFLGSRRIKTRNCTSLAEATLSITSLDMLTTDAQRSAFDQIDTQVYTRRLGGDCYNYSLLAAGCIDLVIEGELGPWDIQSHIPVIEAACGVITNWRGEPVTAGGWVVAAGDPRVHEQALTYLQKAAPDA